MEIKSPMYKPEVWGGIECTINRVQDVFRDQLKDTGHYTRRTDIEHLAVLGFDKIRYPILWERHQPLEHGEIDWTWINQQLTALQEQSITPIAGLLHHGSGPAFTNLLDEDFPYLLANYAGLVAQQFPWLEYYTPVNEPLTTARFSGLYGHWYPHHTNEPSFIRMVVHQVKAIVLSMKKIRAVNPNAKLVQTEDLSKIHSTSLLTYQADFENKRRWLTYDLLCGNIDKHHFFWEYMIKRGIKEHELFYFLQNPCPPDIMGFNYYVTSERYLDEHSRGESPPSGGNGKHHYHDGEAVRSGHAHGMMTLLSEAWSRYQLPMAVTECHLNCTPGQQLKWLKETWDTCCQISHQGIPLKAMTVWSLLGAYDWNSLLTKNLLEYEPGAFDVREGHLRETALADMIKTLTRTGSCDHPGTDREGWWQHESMQTSFHPIVGEPAL